MRLVPTLYSRVNCFSDILHYSLPVNNFSPSTSSPWQMNRFNESFNRRFNTISVLRGRGEGYQENPVSSSLWEESGLGDRSNKIMPTLRGRSLCAWHWIPKTKKIERKKDFTYDERANEWVSEWVLRELLQQLRYFFCLRSNMKWNFVSKRVDVCDEERAWSTMGEICRYMNTLEMSKQARKPPNHRPSFRFFIVIFACLER